MLGRYVIAYIDDILVYSPTLSVHTDIVRQVLQKLLVHRLYVKVEKCLFHQTAISFLGYCIGPAGVSMEENQVAVVRQRPIPKTIKERFLGFATFYRRLIRKFGSVAVPLTALLKGKPSSLRWTKDANHTFG